MLFLGNLGTEKEEKVLFMHLKFFQKPFFINNFSYLCT